MPNFTEQTARDFWASLDEKSKLALAKTAPSVVPPWRDLGGSATRDYPDGDAGLAHVLRSGDKWEALTGGVDVVWSKLCDTKAAAKSAVDARLREMGFVLEDGE